MVTQVNSESGQSSPPRESRMSSVLVELDVVVGAALVGVVGGEVPVVFDPA